MTHKEMKRVLIVDGDDGFRTALKMTLKTGGYEVDEASSAQHGLERLREFRPHMVISDYLMPAMTGLEFLRMVRARSPDAILILAIGHAEVNVALEAINQGEIFQFITKPWDATEILTILNFGFQHLAAQDRHRGLLAYLRRLSPMTSQDTVVSTSMHIVADDIGGVIGRLLALQDQPDFYDAVPNGRLAIA